MTIIKKSIAFAKKILRRDRHLSLEKKINQMTKEFSQLYTIDITPNIKDSLRKLSKLMYAKCAYFVFFAADKGATGQTISWCSREHGQCSMYLSRYSKISMPTFDKTIRAAKIIQITDISKLGNEWKKEKAVWLQNNVNALICLPLIIEKKVIGYVGFNFSRKQKESREDDMALLTTFYEMLSISLERQMKREEIVKHKGKPKTAIEEVVKAIASTIKKHDSYTEAHQLRSAKLSVAIAKELKLKEKQIKNIYLAALIHDVGKIYLPSEVLNKPGPLSKSEMKMVKMHPLEGFNIIANLALDPTIKEMILTHHEHLDGSGYPKGLHGRQIKIGARILIVADVVEAIYTKRSYHPQRTMKETLSKVKKYSGVRYDPKVIDACIRVITEKKFSFEAHERVTEEEH